MRNTFGKGLESLIPKKTNIASEPADVKKDPIFYIGIEKIKSNPYQPRKDFDQDSLRDLADSIKEHGILQPLLVSRIATESGAAEYQLVAGERRLLASKMLGLTQVPIIIRDATQQEKLIFSVIENVQRQDLNAMEKALAYRRMHDEFNLQQKDIARMVGKSREAVANTMRLLDLSEEMKSALREGKISEGHARAMLAVNDPEKQKSLFVRTVRDGWSVREVESLTQKLNIWQPVRKQLSALSREVKDFEEKIREIVGVKTLKLRMEAGRPKLTIFFNSRKELENLLRKIK